MEIYRVRKAKLSLDIAPLIDVVFQLLVFFMLASTFANPSLDLQLPRAVEQKRQEREITTISITQDGTIFLNTNPIQRDSLKGELESLLREQPQKVVHLKGDKDMPYKYFVEIMDIARQAGAVQVNIVHQPLEQ